jgi:hypothetical protein
MGDTAAHLARADDADRPNLNHKQSLDDPPPDRQRKFLCRLSNMRSQACSKLLLRRSVTAIMFAVNEKGGSSRSRPDVVQVLGAGVPGVYLPAAVSAVISSGTAVL